MTEVPVALESRTRDRVLQAISEDGPITATALATRLGLTTAAVRRHLEALADAGVISGHASPRGRRGRGRPARAWVVSEAGHSALGSDYDHLATEALRFLTRTAGPDAVRAFADERVRDLERRYADELAGAGEDPAARAEALAGALTRDGFAASTRPVRAGAPGPRAPEGPAAPPTPGPLTGVQLCQGHCPVQHAAREFPQFCDAETDAFSRLLGVHVQRLATLAHGEHVCTTFVPTPAVPTAHPADSHVPAPKERSTR